MFKTKHPARRARVAVGAVGASSYVAVMGAIAFDARADQGVDTGDTLSLDPAAGQTQADASGFDLSGGAAAMPADPMTADTSQTGGIAAAPAPAADPLAPVAAPVEQQPVDTTPPETTPPETAPAETQPHHSQPVETAPPETAPPETQAPVTTMAPVTTAAPTTTAPTTTTSGGSSTK